MTTNASGAKRLRAYSLIELALTMVIAGIITTAALSTFSVVNRQLVQSRTEAGVETKLQRTLAGLAGDLQEVGGGPLRPWHALYVYPGTVATGGSDAIMAFAADGEYTGLPCPVTSYVPPVLTVGLVPDPDPTLPARCCLIGASLDGRFAAITRTGDTVIVGLDDTSRNVAACTITAPVLVAPERIDATHDWDTGTMTIVDAKWIAVDHVKHELNAYMLEYLPSTAPNVPGEAPPGRPIAVDSETRVLAKDVYDFQVATGYDTDVDGVMDEERDGDDDEWLGNAAGETASGTWVGDDRTESTFKNVHFRMIDIGIIVGLRRRSGAVRHEVGVLDGPRYPSTATPRCMDDHSRIFMRAGRARVLLRNSGVYE